jgi:hypothetical protein
MTHHHLTDEQISAFIDGESADDAEQIAQCETCLVRRDQLEEARDLLRVPVTPVAPAVRSAAVAAALAGAQAGTELEAAASQGGSAVGDLSRPRRRRPSGDLVGTVAAAVVVLGLAVGIPVGLSHGGGSSPTASSAARAAPHGPEKTAPTLHPASTGSSASGTGTQPIPDLGSFSSTSSLRNRLSVEQQLKALRPGPVDAGSATTENSTSDQAAPPAFATAGLPAASATCVADARAVVGSTDRLLLVATARYRNIPALVVVVQAPVTATATTASRPVVVVARTDCRVLAVTHL